LSAVENLAALFSNQNKFSQAEALQRQNLEVSRRVFGPEHPQTLLQIQNLADTLFARGKYAEAVALDVPLLEVRRRVLPPENPDTLTVMNNLANVYASQGKYAEVETLQTKRHGQSMEEGAQSVICRSYEPCDISILRRRGPRRTR
jgi:hypothetical protein